MKHSNLHKNNIQTILYQFKRVLLEITKKVILKKVLNK